MYRLRYAPEGLGDIRELRSYITRESTRRIADGYIRRLKDFCAELALAPYRGERRLGLREGQRSIGFERRVSVIFEIDEAQQLVTIIAFRYGGRTYVSR